MTDFERQLLADVQKMKSGHKVLVSLIWALALVLMFIIGTVAYCTYDYINSLVIEYECSVYFFIHYLTKPSVAVTISV